MDIEEIKTLTELMVDHDLSEIMIRDGDKRIVIRRGLRGATQIVASGGLATAGGVPLVTGPAGSGQPAPSAPTPAKEDPNLHKVTSPMVGTYYETSDPESAPFVKVGDRVGPDTVVCIIEAMKVFNEIKAETTGTVESIEIQSGSPVEFGQVMMTVRVS